MFIDEALYKKIIQSIPILCVDLVVKKANKYLLLLRKNEPLKDHYYLPGGRINLGESISKAASRKLFEETGIVLDNFKIFGIYQDSFNKNSFDSNVLYHTVSIVFSCEVDLHEIILDEQSSDYLWADELPKRFIDNCMLVSNNFV